MWGTLLFGWRTVTQVPFSQAGLCCDFSISSNGFREGWGKTDPGRLGQSTARSPDSFHGGYYRWQPQTAFWESYVHLESTLEVFTKRKDECWRRQVCWIWLQIAQYVCVLKHTEASHHPSLLPPSPSFPPPTLSDSVTLCNLGCTLACNSSAPAWYKLGLWGCATLPLSIFVFWCIG